MHPDLRPPRQVWQTLPLHSKWICTAGPLLNQKVPERLKSLLQDDMHKLYMNPLYAWAHLTSPVIPWHQALSLAFCCLVQMGQWIPNEPVEIQPGIHYQTKTRCDPHQPSLKYGVKFQKGAQVSAPLSLKHLNKCGFDSRLATMLHLG